MNPLLLVLIIVLVLCAGGGYLGAPHYGYVGYSPLGGVLVLLILLWLFGVIR